MKVGINMKSTRIIYCISFLVVCVLWIFLITFIKQYLIERELYTQSAKYILAVILFVSFYLTYRWFGKHAPTGKK